MAITTFGVVTVSFLLASVLFLAGCSDTLEGDVYDNQRPDVHFVNIPPDGQDFSANPIVYWFGSDNDGLVAYYRYHIITRSSIGDMAPEDYVLTLSDEVFVTCDTILCDTITVSGTPCDTSESEIISICDSVSDWTYIYVDPTAANPQTANSLPLRADTSNPVLNFVQQYVFLQAFDTEGLGSEIVWRVFKRNDNPPQTVIELDRTKVPFVNAEEAGGIVTGIGLGWRASDEIDYPTDPPPFEFEWRLYGPFTNADTLNIHNNFVKDVFVTNDGFIYDVGDTIIRCDSLYTDTGLVEHCDSVVVVSGMPSTVLGEMDVLFDVDNPGFINSEYNLVVDSSFNGIDTWILNTTDTIYNVFKDYPSGETIELNFIFWARARDDAFVPDIVPAFEQFKVINPKFERDVAVLDFTYSSGITLTKYKLTPNNQRPDTTLFNYPNDFHILPFWADLIRTWNVDLPFEYSDYYFVKSQNNMKLGLDLKTLLSYKVLIIYNEHIYPSDLRLSKFEDPLWKAIDAGVNVWSTMRAPVEGGTAGPLLDISESYGNMSSNYRFYFGVARTQFSGWFCKAAYIGPCVPKYRAEDFIGAYSLKPDQWPEVKILPELVENRTYWDANLVPFLPELPCIPEVNWSEAAWGSEVMYLYKSIYGADHPLGIDPQYGFDWVMEGTPVGHRFKTGLFRTVHFDFTPLCIDTTTTDTDGDGIREVSPVQALVNNVLDYLYDPSIAAPVSEIRYNDAGQSLSVSEMRRRYWERNNEAFIEKTGGSLLDHRR
ncbi:MAG: hypothetical protein KOO62_09635 [candidate division Zixibacteria bacterium]|nr:hypothetical protein [candidate division Zixibacteria bacterium]